MTSKPHRLLNLLVEFAGNFEFKVMPSYDKKSARLLVSIDGWELDIRYQFSQEDSYEFVTPLDSVSNEDLADIASSILVNNPVIGITERIVDGRLVILGGRGNLDWLSDARVMRLYQDDISRLSDYVRSYPKSN